MVSQAEILAAQILIVDDKAANVYLLQQILQGAGYQHVSFTQNPLEVCELHSSHQYDLIVLDIQMHDMDGFTVMASLKEREKRGYAPVLVITAYPNHKRRALASGAQDFIAKPFDVVELKTRIHNLLKVRLLYKHLEVSNRALESMALHDPLTGLPNRRLLMDRIRQATLASTRSKSHGALMFLDIDNFKQLNDTLGHSVGDLLLQQVASRLQACVREGDSVARQGGDEFVVLLASLGPSEQLASDQAELISAKILDSFSHAFQLDVHQYRCDVSIGLVIFQGDAVRQDELLQKADTAMYQAKAAGGNRAYFFKPELQASIERRRTAE